MKRRGETEHRGRERKMIEKEEGREREEEVKLIGERRKGC